MIKMLADKKHVYHLHEHAISVDSEEKYEYLGWDTKSEKLYWIKGNAAIVEDVLCLGSIVSEGEEDAMETPFEVKCELEQLPKWDKTKYYCVVLGGKQAALPKYCETGKLLQQNEDDYTAVREMLRKHGIEL